MRTLLRTPRVMAATMPNNAHQRAMTSA